MRLLLLVATEYTTFNCSAYVHAQLAVHIRYVYLQRQTLTLGEEALPVSTDERCLARIKLSELSACSARPACYYIE